MIKKSKRTSEVPENTTESKQKVLKTSESKSTASKNVKFEKPTRPDKTKPFIKKDSPNKEGKFKKEFSNNKNGATKSFYNQNSQDSGEKTNWMEFKKKKKELKLKRKQAKTLYEVIVEAKKIAEELRQKNLKGGKEERKRLVLKLHELLGGKEQYAKLVASHDTARIVQYLLKFAPENIRNDISKEIIPASVEMLQSKYGRYCLKNMLKYGNGETRSASLNSLYGHAVKLTSHVVSASVFEYAYSTWASPQQKHHFIQEFFGDMYKQTKDDQVKHLRDVYKNSPAMKAAALSSTKANLSRILNKDLLDSTLVQSVLQQFLSECTVEDRTELISQLAPHVVIVSNSKDGARVAMQCIWHGTNKDRKVALKALKEHVVELSKHEHGHATIIALLDAADDTVLVNKMIIGQILGNIRELASDEWGRKVLLWLVAPGDSTHFHPVFIKELDAGREASTSKKTPEIRRAELLQYSNPSLLENVASDPKFWLSTASISVITLSILKSSPNNEAALEGVVETITNPEWKIKDDKGEEVLGIEHPGLHMILKKLAQHDKANNSTFGRALLAVITDTTLKLWLKLNRGCFFLVAIYENGNKDVQEQMNEKLGPHKKALKKHSSTGAQILLKKLKQE